MHPRGRARSRQNGRNFTNGTFHGQSPFMYTAKNLPFSANLAARKRSARTQKSLNARDSPEHPHATPASLRRSGADASFRGFFSKCELQTFLCGRNEFGARLQEPSHKRIPGKGVWIPGVAPGRARTGGTSRMALFAANPLLCKQQKIYSFRRTFPPAKGRHGLKNR